jgi:hypothetical protein
MSAPTYLVYVDSHKEIYFYDIATCETTYNRPATGTFLDCVFRQPFIVPDVLPGPTVTFAAAAPAPEAVRDLRRSVVVDVPDSVRAVDLNNTFVVVQAPAPRRGTDPVGAMAAIVPPKAGRRRSTTRDDYSNSDTEDQPTPPPEPSPTDTPAQPPGEDEPPLSPPPPPAPDDAAAAPAPPSGGVRPNLSHTSSADRIQIRGAGSHFALPATVTEEIQKFQVADFAEQFFREHRVGTVFSRKKVSVEALTAWQGEPLNAPLLQMHTKQSQKLAIEAFKLILAYSGSSGQPDHAVKLVDMLVNCPQVRDEVYFQLIKQTRSNPDPMNQIRTWQLFLIVASLFPSTRDSEVWVKSHLSRCLDDKSVLVSELAQFTYIRFGATCAKGQPPSEITKEMITAIPGEIEHGTRTFGATLYEQLFHQRVKHPACPFPFAIHVIAEKLFEMGAESCEGVFRIPGNGKKVLQLEDEVNHGNLALEAGLHDIGSLFKVWFAKLPEPIVGVDLLGTLKSAYETKTFVEFVENLPHAHLLTLRYLIGFLQRLAKAEGITKMTPKNLAMVFAPNLVALDHIRDPMQIAAYTEMIQEFICTLILSWDTSDVYPAPDYFFETE